MFAVPVPDVFWSGDRACAAHAQAEKAFEVVGIEAPDRLSWKDGLFALWTVDDAWREPGDDAVGASTFVVGAEDDDRAVDADRESLGVAR